MIVMSRKKNEAIVINDNITIVVVEIRGDKVRLGIDAPKEIPFHRREVWEAIQRETAEPLDTSEVSAVREKKASLRTRVNDLISELTSLEQLEELEKRIRDLR